MANLGNGLGVSGVMKAGDTVTSPLGLAKLKFTDDGQLALEFNGKSTPLTSNGPATTCTVTGTGLVINSVPKTTLGSSSGPIEGLDVQDDGEAVLYTTTGVAAWTGSASNRPMVTEAVEIGLAIMDLKRRFLGLASNFALSLAAKMQK